MITGTKLMLVNPTGYLKMQTISTNPSIDFTPLQILERLTNGLESQY